MWARDCKHYSEERDWDKDYSGDCPHCDIERLTDELEGRDETINHQCDVIGELDERIKQLTFQLKIAIISLTQISKQPDTTNTLNINQDIAKLTLGVLEEDDD